MRKLVDQHRIQISKSKQQIATKKNKRRSTIQSKIENARDCDAKTSEQNSHHHQQINFHYVTLTVCLFEMHELRIQHTTITRRKRNHWFKRHKINHFDEIIHRNRIKKVEIHHFNKSTHRKRITEIRKKQFDKINRKNRIKIVKKHRKVDKRNRKNDFEKQTKSEKTKTTINLLANDNQFDRKKLFFVRKKKHDEFDEKSKFFFDEIIAKSKRFLDRIKRQFAQRV